MHQLDNAGIRLATLMCGPRVALAMRRQTVSFGSGQSPQCGAVKLALNYNNHGANILPLCFSEPAEDASNNS